MSKEAKELVKEMPKVSPDTVKGKIAAIKNQMKENQEAVAAIWSGVRAIQSAILEQIKENQAYIMDFRG